jgi:hypothetical protein
VCRSHFSIVNRNVYICPRRRSVLGNVNLAIFGYGETPLYIDDAPQILSPCALPNIIRILAVCANTLAERVQRRITSGLARQHFHMTATGQHNGCVTCLHCGCSSGTCAALDSNGTLFANDVLKSVSYIDWFSLIFASIMNQHLCRIFQKHPVYSHITTSVVFFCCCYLL